MSAASVKAEKTLLHPDFRDLITSITLEEEDESQALIAKLLKFMMAPMEEIGEPGNPENSDLPAGYTYFGQFLAHDISAHRFIPNAPPSLRALSIYGMGPGQAPYIYQYKPLQKAGLRFRGVKFNLESYTSDFGVPVSDVLRHGLNPDKFAPQRLHSVPLMADARNDQNFIISQLTVALMELHNFIVDAYYMPDGPEDGQGALFSKAATAFVALYQAVILYDYLPRMLYDKSLISKLKESNDHFLIYTGKPGESALSEIFSRAALRYGHTQVRQIYKTFENREAMTLFSDAEGELDLRGFVRDTRRAMDLRLFFETKENKAIQAAKRINHRLSLPLNELPFLRKNDNSLPHINLRHSAYNFPSGLDFYQKLSNQRVSALTGSEKSAFTDKWTSNNLKKELDNIANTRFKNKKPNESRSASTPPTEGNLDVHRIPLWLFILLESEITAEGKKLGPLGSRIVAEQIMWVLKDDPNSIINRPDLFPADLFPGNMKDFKLSDMLTIARRPVSLKVSGDSGSTTRIEAHPGEQAYQGTELKALPDEASFKTYVDPAKSLVHRTQTINNGFYDIDTPRDKDYIDLLRKNEYKEPGGKAKQQIRVYVSAKSILYNLGYPIGSSEFDNKLNQKEIKGLLFVFGLDEGKIVFIVKRIGIDGKIPESANDVWYLTHQKALIDESGRVWNEALEEQTASGNLSQNEMYALLAGAFIKDGFGTLKNVGMPDPVQIDRKVLLHLLAEDDLAGGAPGPAQVSFYLCLTKGSDILTTHNLWDALPLGAPTAEVPEAYFFSLALKSSVDNNEGSTVYYSEENRSYPYWCYL